MFHILAQNWLNVEQIWINMARFLCNVLGDSFMFDNDISRPKRHLLHDGLQPPQQCTLIFVDMVCSVGCAKNSPVISNFLYDNSFFLFVSLFSISQFRSIFVCCTSAR